MNIAIKPRQAIRLMMCVCVCVCTSAISDFAGVEGVERDRGSGGGLIGGCSGHECLYTEANIETDRRTDTVGVSN